MSKLATTECPKDCPADAVNLYDDDVINHPWPHYARLRALGPVVWLPALGNYALTRHEVVRAALRDYETFVSAQGVAADAFGCTHLQGNTVASDPPRHTALRKAMMPPLTHDSLQDVRRTIQGVACEAVSECVEAEQFDAISELAQVLPLSVVRDLVGLPDFGRERMLAWAGAAFDVLGIQNERGRAGREMIAEMRDFIRQHATPENLKPGSWTHRVSELAASGKLEAELAPFAIRDYINPSLDTTISAIGHLIFALGRDPDAWHQLKAQTSLVTNAAHEAVRIATPIRSFSRHTSKAVEVAGTRIPAGARVMMLFASANRDEAVFTDADQFVVDRENARRHLGFGQGRHMCLGMHLAIMEIECLLLAMLAQVDTIEVGTPEVAMNNTICAYRALPATFHKR